MIVPVSGSSMSSHSLQPTKLRITRSTVTSLKTCYVCMRACTLVGLQTHMYACMHVLRECMPVWVHMCVYVNGGRAYACACTHAHVSSCVYRSSCVCAGMCACEVGAYVRMYVRMYVRGCVRACELVHACMHPNSWAGPCMCACVRVHVNSCARARVRPRMLPRARACARARACVRASSCELMGARICMCARSCVCVRARACASTHVHACMHACDRVSVPVCGGGHVCVHAWHRGCTPPLCAEVRTVLPSPPSLPEISPVSHMCAPERGL